MNETNTRDYHDTISERAREIWHHRGQPFGQDVEIWLQAERELVNDGLIPPAPPPRLSNLVRGKAAADDIDQRELQRRLGDFGSSGARSATSVDPSTP